MAVAGQAGQRPQGRRTGPAGPVTQKLNDGRPGRPNSTSAHPCCPALCCEAAPWSSEALCQGWALVALGRPGRPSFNFCVTGPAGPVRRPCGLWPAWPAAAISQLAGLAGSPAGNGRLLSGQLLAGRPGRGGVTCNRNWLEAAGGGRGG